MAPVQVTNDEPGLGSEAGEVVMFGIHYGGRAGWTCWDLGMGQSQGGPLHPGLNPWKDGGPFSEVRMGWQW